MQVVGITNQQEVWVASKERRFKINEILIIEDSLQGDQKGEVVETNSYNKYVPMALNSDLVDNNVLKSLAALGYKVDDDTIHIAKVRLLIEAEYPIQTAAAARIPKFDEVKSLLVNTEPHKGLVVGAIKSTKEMVDELPHELSDISPICKNDNYEKQDGVPFIFDIYKMNQYPHIGIFGGSGSGKSFGLRVLIEELMKLKIPTIVLDPHYEMDFSETVGINEYKGEDFNGKFECMQVGYEIGVNFVDLSVGDLKNLLSAISPLSEAMSGAVDELHRKKDTYQSFSERIKLLSEALEEGKNSIQEKLTNATEVYEQDRYKECLNLLNKYGNIPSASVKAIAWRLSVLDKQGIFNNDITAVEDGLKSGKMVIIRGSSKLLQVFATYLLNNLYRKRRDYKDAQFRKIEGEYFPPFVIVTDEAHNFAPKAFESPSKYVLKEIAQEGRKYGVFLIFATQRPTLLDETITAQLNTKIVFRTVRGTDIATIKEETDITQEEAKRLPYLQSGDAFVSSAIMGRTIPVRIRAAKTASPHTKNPFAELEEESQKEQNKLLELIVNKLPFFDGKIADIIASIEKEKGIRISHKEMISKLEMLVRNGKIAKRETPFGVEWNAS